jgi:hypothetical protein
MSSKYIQLTGTNSLLTVPAHSALVLGNSSWLLSMWVNLTKHGSTMLDALWSLTNDPNEDEPLSMHLIKYDCYAPNYVFTRLVYQQQRCDNNVTEGPVYQTSDPEHWVLVNLKINRTTNIATYYINGVQIGNSFSVAANEKTTTLTSDMLIGGTYSGNLKAGIDDIRFYKGTAAQIEAISLSAIYNGGYGTKLTGQESYLVWGSNCDDGSGLAVTNVKGGSNGVLQSGITWQNGGTPIAPTGVAYYIVKRSGVVVAYTLDPVSSFDFKEDVSLLANGYYDYTLTSVGINGIEGAESDPLRLKVTSGALSFVPAIDPTGLTISSAAAGKFKLSWLYPITFGMNLPDKFNVYYSLNGTSWTKDGELNFVIGQTPAYTTVNSWTNGTLVYFKVQAQKGSEEKTNSVSVSATADTVGPTVSDPAIVVDVM